MLVPNKMQRKRRIHHVLYIHSFNNL
jgi:hypothetical protein